MKLVKTWLSTQLKQTYLENQLHISTGSPKEDTVFFNDTVFHHFVDELKHCKRDCKLVPFFLCLYSVYLVVILSFSMIFFHSVFSFISFPFFLMSLQYFSPLLQDLIVIFNENFLQ